MKIKKIISILLSMSVLCGTAILPTNVLAEETDEVYSVITKATGEKTIVDTSKIAGSNNISGYLITVASDNVIVNQEETEAADSITVQASVGDDIEIAPIYEYKETQEYGNGVTLPDVFPDGRYNITVTNGSANHTDIYVNGYMTANNIDQNGYGRSVSKGSTYTSSDVKVEGGSIKIQTKDSANSLSYVKVVKTPSIVTPKKKIFITGDSLVANYYGGNEGNYLGNTQTGWGQVLEKFINSNKYEIVNLSNAGYWAETLRTTAFSGIIYNASEGDIFLLESGVNDYWNPASKGATENLPENRATMKNAVTAMVQGAKEVHLPVILVNPNAQPSRHDTTNCFSDVMLEVAKEQNVQSIDLAAKSSAVLNELYNGRIEDIKKNFDLTKSSDNTHSSYLGAMKYASIVATELYRLGYTDMFNTAYEYTKNDTLGNSIVCKVDTSVSAVTPAPDDSPVPNKDKCTKITAEYNPDGTLKDVRTEEISISDIEPINNTAAKKVFYWDSLGGMKPVYVNSETPAPDDTDYMFTFGTANISDGIAVTEDTPYGRQSNGMTYGFYGVSGAPDVSNSRTDGYKNTQTDPYTVLKSGEINGKSYVRADYSEYDETTLANMANGLMPIRFSVEAEQHKYYTITVTAVNTSSTESTEITLYSEKRHAILAGYTLDPNESVTKTFNVNLESIYYNNVGLVEDTQLNISLIGKNAGLSSVSVKKHDTMGKTIWMCTDSTGCDQYAEVPYFALRNYSGTGSALAKYINPEIAVSNQGEGGLRADDTNHFNNAVAHMNKGDYLYVQYGLNDRDTAAFKTQLEKYYTAAHNKGVRLIIVSPSDRHGSASWDSTTKKWKSIAAGFATACSEFVENKISNGADDIAYIDLNTKFIDWMNNTEQVILEQRQRLGFGDTAIDTRAMDYYYMADRRSGVDTIHINDYGTDNAAYIVMQEAKRIVEAGKADNATNSAKIQSSVLAELVENMSNSKPCEVSDEIISAGWAINNCYPYPSSEEVNYQYPTMVRSVSVENSTLKSITVKVQGAMNSYAQGCADILNADGSVKETVYTVSTDINSTISHIDNTAAKYGDIVTMYFDGNITIPQGGSYRVYLKGKENGAELPGNEYYSSIYNEQEAVKDYLMTSTDGKTAECFAYNNSGENIVDKGADSSSGTNKWQFAGSSNTKQYHIAEKDNMNGAIFAQNGSGTYSLCKFFNGYKQISNGKVKLHFQINYISGNFTLKFNQSGKIASSMEGLEILRIADGEVQLCDGSSAGKIKTAKWTDIDITIDIDRGVEEASIAGGDNVSCNIDKLQTSSWSDVEYLLPMKGFTITYTANPSTIPSYPFEFYMTDLLVTTVDSETPQININSVTEDETMGIVTGNGTYDINSDVTLTASAKDGYAFVGWYSGNNLYSQENPLTATKVREDLSLTAKFAVQKTKDETASFDITANKDFVRYNSTLQLSIENAKDKDGYNVGDLTASDIEWSTDEAGVSINTDGLVSFDSDFNIGENTTKTVKITGRINNTNEEYTMTVYSYAYYEIMNSKITNYDGLFQTIAI